MNKMQEYITIPTVITAYQVDHDWIVVIEGEKMRVPEKIFNTLFVLKEDYEMMTGNEQKLT